MLQPVLVTSASSGSLDTDIVSLETEESRDSPITTYTDKIPVFKDPKFVVGKFYSYSNEPLFWTHISG